MDARGSVVAVLIACSAPLAVPSQAAGPAVAVPTNVRLQLPPETISRYAGHLVSPMPGVAVTSPFGWRRHPTLKRQRFHGGVDFGAPSGTRVHAAGAGVVEVIARSRDRGLYVRVRHDDRLVTGYSHLSAVPPGLKVGQRVDARAWIGKVGRSGRSSGPHLDFEVFVDDQRVDPGLMVALYQRPSVAGGRLLKLSLDLSPASLQAVDVHGEDDDPAPRNSADITASLPPLPAHHL